MNTRLGSLRRSDCTRRAVGATRKAQSRHEQSLYPTTRAHLSTRSGVSENRISARERSERDPDDREVARRHGSAARRKEALKGKSLALRDVSVLHEGSRISQELKRSTESEYSGRFLTRDSRRRPQFLMSLFAAASTGETSSSEGRLAGLDAFEATVAICTMGQSGWRAVLHLSSATQSSMTFACAISPKTHRKRPRAHRSLSRAG